MFKNLLIIIVAAAVYLHFYPNEELTKWSEEQKIKLDGFFGETFDTKARVSPQVLLNGLKSEIKQFSTREVNYVEDIVSSRTKLKEFHKEYCGTTKRNPSMRDKQVDQVCEKIAQYNIL